MPVALPTPEEVRASFSRLLERDPEKATHYLYELGLASGYLKKEAFARNIYWTAESPYGTLECSINCSKPEKDPREIEAAALSERRNPPCVTKATPQCELCWENEDFPGTPEHPAKPGLRIASIPLGGEEWGFQYSPYAYYPEHCIALSRQHRPMKIDRACFERLLDFADLFPFYFVGSNADLPLVGGSILSHDHFQGGRHLFPLMKAPIEREVALWNAPEVHCGVVAWPASVLRLSSNNAAALVQAANIIRNVWQQYSNEACSITAFSTSDTEPAYLLPHNTVNPIVRKRGHTYLMDLVLRNNRTDSHHPWGIFHPSEPLHHIKKENIGLIEIMGLAILPSRLATELPLLQQKLIEAAHHNCRAQELHALLIKQEATLTHAAWATEVYEHRATEFLAKSNSVLHPVIQEEVARVYTTILDTTGVFKHTPAGRAGWDSFIDQINLYAAKTKI